MTEVRIPVSADVQGGVSSIDRLVTALRKAGQEGKRFSDIDWNLPDLKKFAADAKHMQDRFQDISSGRVRGATAQAVRSGKYPDFVSWASGYSGQFTTARERENHQANVMRYIGAGTQFGTGGAGGGGGGGGGGGAGGGGGITPFPVGGMLKGMAALAGIGGVMSMAGKGLSAATDEATSIDRLLRSVNDTSHSFERFREIVRHAGDGLQLSNEETARLTNQFTKLSNAATVSEAARGTRNAVGFARSFGLAEDSTVAKFAQAKFMGAATDQKQFAVMIADAISVGKMWSKGDEVLSAVLNWFQTSESILARAPNPAGYVDIMTRMNASGVPGLRGQQGAVILGQLDQGIRHPGMGEAGMTMLWRALSQGKPLDPFEFKYRLEEGAFGGKKGGPTNLQLVMDTMKQMYGPGAGKDKLHALSNMFPGTSMHQWEALLGMGSVKAGKLGARLGKLGINEFNMSSAKDMAQINDADQGGLDAWRKSMLERGDVSRAQKDSLSGKSGEALRDALLRISAATGRESNVATDTLQSIKDLSNMVETSAAKLLEPLNAIRNVTVGVGNLLGVGGDALPGKGSVAESAMKALLLPFRERSDHDTPPKDRDVNVNIRLTDEDGTARARKELRVAQVRARRDGRSRPSNAPEAHR